MEYYNRLRLIALLGFAIVCLLSISVFNTDLIYIKPIDFYLPIIIAIWFVYMFIKQINKLNL